MPHACLPGHIPPATSYHCLAHFPGHTCVHGAPCHSCGTMPARREIYPPPLCSTHSLLFLHSTSPMPSMPVPLPSFLTALPHCLCLLRRRGGGGGEEEAALLPSLPSPTSLPSLLLPRLPHAHCLGRRRKEEEPGRREEGGGKDAYPFYLLGRNRRKKRKEEKAHTVKQRRALCARCAHTYSERAANWL